MPAAETVTVPGTPAGVQQALDAIEALARRRGLAEDLRRKVLTALDEVLSNIARQGAPGLIVLTVTSAAPRLDIEVSDAGDPFDPLARPVPDTTAGLDERQPGGLGIMLVRRLADDVRYERLDGRNRLTMTWWTVSGRGAGSHADH